VALLLPFLYVYAPAIILQFQGLSTTDIFVHFATAPTLILAISPLFANYCFIRLNLLEWILFLVGGLSSILAVAFSTETLLIMVIGIISCLGGYLLNYRRSRAV
jgi:TRAP-type uncharacterized transport system fused permease subunit